MRTTWPKTSLETKTCAKFADCLTNRISWKTTTTSWTYCLLACTQATTWTSSHQHSMTRTTCQSNNRLKSKPPARITEFSSITIIQPPATMRMKDSSTWRAQEEVRTQLVSWNLQNSSIAKRASSQFYLMNNSFQSIGISASKDLMKRTCWQCHISSKGKSPEPLSKYWTHQLSKTITILTWSTGQARTLLLWDWAHAFTFGPHRLRKWPSFMI